jgi:hypothetical protein
MEALKGRELVFREIQEERGRPARGTKQQANRLSSPSLLSLSSPLHSPLHSLTVRWDLAR